MIGLLFAAGGARAAQSENSVLSAQSDYLKGLLLEDSDDAGSQKAALDAYARAFSRDPYAVTIARQAAELALRLGALPDAENWAKKVLALAPKDAKSYLLLGQVQWAKNRMDEAKTSFKKALELDPSSKDAELSLASLIAPQEPEKAETMLQDFIAKNPESGADGWHAIGQIEFAAGHLAKAQEAIKKAIALEGPTESLDSRYGLAMTYELQGSTDSALAVYQQMLEIDPNNVAWLNRVGRLYELKGDKKKSLEAFRDAKNIDPADPTANRWLATDAEGRGDCAEAARDLTASADLDTDPDLSRHLSYDLTLCGKLKEAVQVLEAAHQKWPNNGDISYYLALGYDDLKKDKAARKLLRDILSVKPDDRDARYELAILLDRDGRWAEAESEFKILIGQSPDDASVLNYLGYTLADRGVDLDQAEALAQKAVQLEPQNGAYLDSLGWVYFKEKKFGEALRALKTASALLPEDETVLDHLGEAYAASGQKDEAWRAWRRSYLRKADPEVFKKIRRVERQIPPVGLGADYLDYFRSQRSGLSQMKSLGRVEGSILGTEFSYPCFVTFKAPDELTLEFLGPLFSPVFRITLSGENLALEPSTIPGVDPAALRATTQGVAEILAGDLSGRLFSRANPVYKNGWFSRTIEAEGWMFWLGGKGFKIPRLRSPSGLSVSLKNFEKLKDRDTTTLFQFKGPGFRLTLTLGEIKTSPPAKR